MLSTSSSQPSTRGPPQELARSSMLKRSDVGALQHALGRLELRATATSPTRHVRACYLLPFISSLACKLRRWWQSKTWCCIARLQPSWPCRRHDTRYNAFLSSLMSVKVLVCGPVHGKIDTLLKRIATVNTKAGPFAAVLCVGAFFEDGDAGAPCPAWVKDLAAGDKSPAVPIYFTGGDGPYPCSSRYACLFACKCTQCQHCDCG